MTTQGKLTKNSFDEVTHELGKNQKMNKNQAIVWIVLIFAIAAVAIFASCSTSHRVSQSASTFKSGDTLTTTIIYQQTGNFKRK